MARLLNVANGGDESGDCAVELLILALWPGLCTVRQRLRPCDNFGTLDADLVAQIAIAIRRADPDRVTRVAATLLLNTERDLRRASMRAGRVARYMPEYMEEQKVITHDSDRPEAIIATAETELGEDGVLITAVHIAGYSQKEAARLVGISHEAARKRCQRALARLQKSSDA